MPSGLIPSPAFSENPAMKMKNAIETSLREAFSPTVIDVEDETHNHNVPEDAQSHFKVTLVSDAFDGLPLLRRHRMVNKVLEGDIRNNIHALALHTMTPQEWFAKGGQSPESPPCLGGGKEDN